MILVESRDLGRIEPLMEASHAGGHRGVAYAVLEGLQAGIVFVDSLQNPQFALVCNYSGFYFAYGTPNSNAFEDFLPELLANYVTDEATMLLAMSPAWEQALSPLFEKPFARAAFEFAPYAPVLSQEWEAQIPEGFRVVPMDRSITQQIEAGAGVDPWFLRIVGGGEPYLKRNFGFCVMERERLASFCGVCGMGGGEAEMEVGTALEYRNRGLATLVCKPFILHCLAHGLTPGYTCGEGNNASASVARKLGFVPTETVSCYPLHKSLVRMEGRWGFPPD